MRDITAKLAGMRKAQEFTVYPFKPGELITVQSDKAIGQFCPVTGQGVLNWRGSGGKYFMHLSKFIGAEDYQFPMDFVEACVSAQPQSGDHIGGGVYVA